MPRFLPLLALLGLGALAPTAAHACRTCYAADPVKQREHDQAKALVPVAQATRVAVASGPWSAPATWSGTQVPGVGDRVHIPEGLAVTYDLLSDAALEWLRVDGTLQFATQASTLLRIDTIVVTTEGVWRMGSAAEPILHPHRAEIRFTDSGPLDPARDPARLGRGLVAFGITEIFGETKTPYGKIVGGVSRGATSLTLDRPAHNWRAGDTLVLAGDRLVKMPHPQPYATQDEIVVVQSVAGSVVTFSPALAHDHRAPRPEFSAYVGNYSRNIVFRSENTNLTEHAQIQRRGHVMFMHSDEVSVNNAAFLDLGRTNKGIPLDDTTAVENDFGVVVGGGGTNVRGRYPLHFHRAGNDARRSPALCRGIAMMNSPGWGVANHSSYVLIEDSVAYNAKGALFVEEAGDAVGAIRRCLAIRSLGQRVPGAEWRTDQKQADHAHAGHGFFLRGNAVDTEDLVAASCHHSGIAWMSKHPQPYPLDGKLPMPVYSLAYPEIANNSETIDWDQVPIPVFRRCEVMAAGIGAVFMFTNMSARHDGRVMTEDFLAWNIREVGLDLNYSAGTTSRNIVVHADPAAMPESRTGEFPGVGVAGHNNTKDVVLVNIRTHGFVHGYQNFSRLDDRVHHTHIVDCDFSDSLAEPVTHPQYATVHRSADLDLGRLNLSITRLAFNTVTLDNGFQIEGVRHDPLGDRPVAGGAYGILSTTGPALRALAARGYHTGDEGPFLAFRYLITNRVTGDIRLGVVRYPIRTDWWCFREPGTLGPNLGPLLDAVRVGRVPVASPAPGAYTRPVWVTLTAGETTSAIHYTTDGSTPTPSSPVYAGPILVNSSRTVRALALSRGYAPSPVGSFAYVVNASPDPDPDPDPDPEPVPVLAAPTGLVASPSGTRARLAWRDRSTGETAYVIEREVEGAPANVVQTTDTVAGTSANSPANEGPARAIDGDTATKYLNFDKLGAGLVLTLTAGPRRVVGLELVSADDSPERDPASVTISGSHDGLAFTPIAQALPVPAFTARFQTRSLTFANSTAYPRYRVVFPAVANAALANSVQLAELRLLAPSGSSWSELARLPADATGALLENLSPSTTYRVRVRAVRGSEFGEPAAPLAFTTTAGPPASPLLDYRLARGLAADGSDDLHSPAGDGVAHLQRYAFALDTPALAGPPAIALEPASGRLRVVFTRRRAATSPGVTYVVEFSDTLAAGSWAANPDATESAEPLDEAHERVSVLDSVAASPRRFARVRVTVE